jgi:hypothetical protein
VVRILLNFLKSTLVLLVITLASCSREAVETTQLRISLPSTGGFSSKAQSVGAQSVSWGLSDPANLADV